MIVRPARPEEAGALAAIQAEAFETPWSEASLRSSMDTPGAVALLADDGDLVGFILLRTGGGEAEVLALAVDPSHRRRGVGRVLLTAGAEATRAKGAETLFLEVAADNTPALSLYRSAGFAEVGRRPAYYPRRQGLPVDALVMRRPVDAPA